MRNFADVGDTTQASAAIKNMFKAIVDDDEMFAIYARMYWKVYVALKQEGFSHDEAMQIVCSPSFKITS